MTAAAVSQWVFGLLDGMTFPPAMTGVPALQAFVVPPNPDVTGTTQPTCWIWMASDDESRDHAKYGAGTVPRAAYPGAASGTKGDEHQVEIYLLYAMGNTDPDSNTLFYGMADAIKATLRSSQDPQIVTDPWTSEQSQVVDVGENMRTQRAVRALADQAMNEFSALITCSVVEIIAG